MISVIDYDTIKYNDMLSSILYLIDSLIMSVLVMNHNCSNRLNQIPKYMNNSLSFKVSIWIELYQIRM